MAFAKIYNKFSRKIFDNKVEIKTLESLRDTLLPKLLSGEIDIKNDRGVRS